MIFSMTKVYHELEPIYDSDSKILILGSIPSVQSRKYGFYYSHPKNRFWKILSIILDEKMPLNKDEKIKLLLKHKIALWDVIKKCDINGSSDLSIKNVECNDINKIIKESKVKIIFTTGRVAKKLYDKYCFEETLVDAIYLPSTSPANCKLSDDDIITEYKKIISYL